MTDGFPAISELIPHSEAMSLLDCVLAHEPDFTVCRVDPRQSTLFADAEGSVPGWIALEYIAQCAAVHGGLAARGEAPSPGLLLGTRKFRLHVDRFRADSALEVTARHHLGQKGLVAFDGSVRGPDGDVLAEGRINLYILEDWSELSR